MAQEISISGGAQLRRLSRDLRREADGKQRTAQLRKELRAVARPLVPVVKASIMSIPSKGQSARAGRTPLRRMLARSVTVQVKTGKTPIVSVFMNPRKMPDGMKSLPMYMEGSDGYTRWRKPTFGHDPWKTQRPNPYFTRAVRPAEAGARQAATRVLEKTAARLEHG